MMDEHSRTGGLTSRSAGSEYPAGDMPKPLICPPELLTKDLTDRRIVVTGANGGIGLVAATQLAKQGAEVIMACRRIDAGEQAAAGIRAAQSDAKLEVLALDLGDLDSVRSFATQLLACSTTPGS
jgi:retinol dehydrogenase-13